MFMDRNTQFFQDVSSSQLDLESIPIKTLENYFVDIDKFFSLYGEAKYPE